MHLSSARRGDEGLAVCSDTAHPRHPSPCEYNRQGGCYTLRPDWTAANTRLTAVANGGPGDQIKVRAHPYDSAAVIRTYARGKDYGEDTDVMLTLVEVCTPGPDHRRSRRRCDVNAAPAPARTPAHVLTR